MKGFGEKLLNRPRHVSLAQVMSGAVVAVTQWLVRGTDDRVVTASNPVRLPHIACVFRRHNKPSVPSIIYGVYDGGPKHCLYKYRFSQ